MAHVGLEHTLRAVALEVHYFIVIVLFANQIKEMKKKAK